MWHLGDQTTTQSNHKERKTVSKERKTASKTQPSGKIKLIRYRNLKRWSLNNFNRKNNPEERDQSKYKETNFPHKTK